MNETYKEKEIKRKKERKRNRKCMRERIGFGER